MPEKEKVMVMCVDAERGKYVAMFANNSLDHGEGFTTQAAIVDLLVTYGRIEVIEK